MAGDRKLILVADDDLNSLEVISQYLQRSGFDVCSVTNGLSAIDIAREEAIDLAILDYNMPDLNGVQVLKVLKEIRPDLNVIIMSAGEISNSTLVEILQAGAYTFLPKPICIPDFRRAVERALQRANHPTVSRQSVRHESVFVRWTSWIVKK